MSPVTRRSLSSEVELTNRAAARSTYAKPVLDHMSLIEPDCSRSEMDRGQEIPGGFVVAGSDGSELFEFGKEIFDEVARFIEFLVKGRRR